MSFFRRRSPEPELTNAVFRRFLRARQPASLPWFLCLNEDVQEELAKMGDEYMVDVCIGIGNAVSANTEPSEEPESMVQRLAAKAIEGLQGSRMAPNPVEHMAGISKRHKENVEKHDRETQQKKDNGRSFAGRKPDKIEDAL